MRRKRGKKDFVSGGSFFLAVTYKGKEERLWDYAQCGVRGLNESSTVKKCTKIPFVFGWNNSEAGMER